MQPAFMLMAGAALYLSFSNTTRGAAGYNTAMNYFSPAVAETYHNIGYIDQIVADRNGYFADVLLGYDTLQDYVNDAYYMGAVVGRYANRIAGSDVWIDGVKYTLPVRPGGYHLQGGVEGFNKKIFNYTIAEYDNLPTTNFQYTSRDGEEGFPGNLQLNVRYTLDNDDQWLVEYSALSDKTT